MQAAQELLEQIDELIRANHWQDQLMAEPLPGDPSRVRVRRRTSANPANAPEAVDVVNIYEAIPGAAELVQTECLRFLRTGRTGI